MFGVLFPPRLSMGKGAPGAFSSCMFMDAPALRTCTTYPSNPHTRKDHLMDPITLQIFINTTLDVIWPMLPPAILDGLAYV